MFFNMGYFIVAVILLGYSRQLKYNTQNIMNFDFTQELYQDEDFKIIDI